MTVGMQQAPGQPVKIAVQRSCYPRSLILLGSDPG